PIKFSNPNNIGYKPSTPKQFNLKKREYGQDNKYQEEIRKRTRKLKLFEKLHKKFRNKEIHNLEQDPEYKQYLELCNSYQELFHLEENESASDTALSDGKLSSKISPHLAKKGGHILRSNELPNSSESEDTSNAEKSDSDKSNKVFSSEISLEITNPNEFENPGEQKGKGAQQAQTHIDKMKNIDILSQNLKETKSHKTAQEKLFEIIQWYDQQTDETQRTYNKDLENEETQYIENTDDALDIRLEQYINLKEPYRRAVMAKLTTIANISKNEEERKRANSRWGDNAAIEVSEESKVIKTKRKTPIQHKHSNSNASITSEAGSSWSEDSAAEDKKFQEEQDKVIGQVLKQ
ncbi:19953_t:CDS:2, partial [Racocetra fulgida]